MCANLEKLHIEALRSKCVYTVRNKGRLLLLLFDLQTSKEQVLMFLSAFLVLCKCAQSTALARHEQYKVLKSTYARIKILRATGEILELFFF